MKKLVKICIAIIMCFGLFLVVNNRVNAEENEDITKIYNESNLRTYLNTTDLFMLGTGKLMNDITVTGTDSLTVKRTKTLDLNGHTITIVNKIGNQDTCYSVFELFDTNPEADLTINATNGGAINANGKGRLFHFGYKTNKLTINGGTYKNGVAYGSDGTTLENGGFVNIDVTGEGSISISNATITNCSAFMGGAIYYSSSATPVNITNTVFKDNIVKERTGSSPYAAGGAIYVTSYETGMSMVLDNVTITGNKSEDYAAGVYVAGSQEVGSVVTLKGKINITDNLEKGTGTEYNQQSNLYLTKGGANVAHVKVDSLDADSKIGTSVNDTHTIVKKADGATASLVNNFINDFPNHIDFIYDDTDGLKTASSLLKPACSTSTAANAQCSIANEQQLRDWASNSNNGIEGIVSSNAGFNKTLTLTQTINVKQTGNSGTKKLSLNGNTIKAADNFNGNVMFNCSDPSPNREYPITITFDGGTTGSNIDGSNKARLFNIGYFTGESSIQLGINVNINNIKGHNGVGDYGGYAYVAYANLTIDGTAPQGDNYISEIYSCEANGADPYSYGGAILVENVADLVVKNTKLYSNKSSNGVGGAIALEANSLIADYPNATINNCLLTDNSAVRAGGAIYHNGWNLTVLNSKITNNTVDNYKWSTYEYEGNGAGIFLSTRNLQEDSTGKIKSNHPNGLVVGGDVYIYGNLGKYKEGGNTIEFPNNVYINYEHEDYRRYIRQDGTTPLVNTSVIGVSITDSKELRKQSKITVAKGFSGLLSCFRFDFWKYGLDIDSNNDINLDEITIYLADDGKAYKNSETAINEITTQLKYANDIEMYTGNIEYKNSRWEINNFDFSTSKTHTIEVEPSQTVLLYGNNTLENTSTSADHAVLYSSGNLTLATNSGNPYTITDTSASNNGYGILTTGALIINSKVSTPVNVNSNNGIGTKASSVSLTAGRLISRGGIQAIQIDTAISTEATFVKGSVEKGSSVSSFEPATFDTNTYKVNNIIAKAISVDEDYGLYLDTTGKIHKNTSAGDVIQVSGISYNSTSKVWHFNNVKHSTHKDTALTFQDDSKVVLGGTNTISTDATNGLAIKVGDSNGHLLTIGNSSQSAYSYLNVNSSNDGIQAKDLIVDNGTIVDVKAANDAIEVEGTLTLGVNESPNHMYAEIHGISTNGLGLKSNSLVANNNNDIYLLAQGSSKALEIGTNPAIVSDIQVLGKTDLSQGANPATYDATSKNYQISNVDCKYVAINAKNYSLYYEDGKIYSYDFAGNKTLASDDTCKKLGISISPDGKRIALKNFNFRTTNNYGLGIKSPSDSSPVELIIDGVNSININEPTKDLSGAIYVTGNSDLVINGYNNATINATTAANAQNGCAAIYVPTGDLTINNASINATSRDTSGTAKSTAIKARDIVINSSNIVANSMESVNGIAVICDSLKIDDSSTLVASGKQYAIKFTSPTGVQAKYIYGTDTMDGTPNKAIKIKDISPTQKMTFASFGFSNLQNIMRNVNAVDVNEYTYVLDDGLDTIAKKLGFNTYKPTPGPSPDPQPKDESCEKVIGPTWHWNNDKGVCEETGIVKTFTR